jgi:hypothetical protein
VPERLLHNVAEFEQQVCETEVSVVGTFMAQSAHRRAISTVVAYLYRRRCITVKPWL